MAWWILAYLVVYSALALGGLWDDWRARRPRWFLGSALLSNVTIIYLFVAFWQPGLRAPLGLFAPVAFVAAVGWELFQAVNDIHELNRDPDLSGGQQRRLALATAIVLFLLCAPAFVVAGTAAFRP